MRYENTHLNAIFRLLSAHLAFRFMRTLCLFNANFNPICAPAWVYTLLKAICCWVRRLCTSVLWSTSVWQINTGDDPLVTNIWPKWHVEFYKKTPIAQSWAAASQTLAYATESCWCGYKRQRFAMISSCWCSKTWWAHVRSEEQQQGTTTRTTHAGV